jgi:hypothetical protein
MCVKITVEPEKMPAEPVPAMARPMIKATDVGAAPQRVEPTSKIPMEMRKTSFVE